MDVDGVTIKASDVLKTHQDQFFEAVDAKFNLLELKRKEVIPDGLAIRIETADDKSAREMLFQHLYRNANVATLREYCRIAKSAGAFPKMQDLGEKMLRDLPPEDSVAPVGRPIIIPDIIDDYIAVKGMFVGVCTTKGTPTLDEVKARCLDLIAGVSIDMPQTISKIKNAQNMDELAHVVCFSLSKWVSYDFFRKVITHFQPTLKSVKKQLKRYEDQLKPLLLQKLKCIAELRLREDAPGTMAELVVKYRLNADGLLVKDLIAERDFLAERLNIPEHLLQVLSWREGSIVVTYWMVRELLPLAELALCREDVQKELTEHGVEEFHLDKHPSKHPGLVDQSLQTEHLQRRAIVTVLDGHHQDVDVTCLTSDLKDMGVLTAEQRQKPASLDDKERIHETLLCTQLAHDEPGTFQKLVECVGLRDSSTTADLQEKTVTVIFPYNGKLEDELDIAPCDIITVDDWDVSDDWAKGTLNGKTGLFFKAFVKPSSEVPSPDDLKLEEVRGKPEGYEATYRGKEYVLKEKLEDVECVVCREVAHELRQTSCCGKTICLGCAETWKKTRTSGSSGSCPECRENFDAIKDPRTQRRLTGANVHCPMYSLGCDWVGSFGRVKQHAKNECPFEMVKCTDVNCKEKVPRRFLELHKSQLCQKRSVACPRCDLATRPGLLNPLPLRYSDIITKHWLECPMWPARCPDACDPYLTLTRGELAAHMKKCSKARIECKFAEVGCRVRVKEEEMDEHLRDAKDEHLTAVFEKYTKAKEDITALTSKCKGLEKENTTICEKHKTLVEEHSKIKEENAKLKSFLSTPLPHPHLMHEFFHSRH